MTGDTNEPGTVYLVGAGPGHPGLITRLGYELLGRCDAVAYDALIPLELIVGLPDRIEKHYAGKRVGKHSRPQEEINELLIRLARRGLDVVRLKGGDPSIFGRSGEEASCLAEAGIPVVVVPGVTAASAAAAMSGFSLTDRRAASWVLLGTGHGAECSSFPVPWDQIASLPAGTIAIYMGLGKLEQISGRLLSAGLSPETPCAAVQCATTGLQKVVDAPLQKLSEACHSQGVKPPAIVFIGEVVRYRLNLESKLSRPLEGLTALAVGPSQQAGRLCGLLRQLGAEPIPHPVLVRKPVDDVDGWARFERARHSGGVCLFTDEVEVRCFIGGLFRRGLDLRSLGRFQVAALGQDTAAALAENGIRADLIVRHSGQAAMTELLTWAPLTKAACILSVRGNPEDPFWQLLPYEEWREVISLTVALDVAADWEQHWKNELLERPPDYILFTRGAEVDGLAEVSGEELFDRLGAQAVVAAVKGSAADAAHRHGLKVEVESEDPAIESLLNAIVNHRLHQGPRTSEAARADRAL